MTKDSALLTKQYVDYFEEFYREITNRLVNGRKKRKTVIQGINNLYILYHFLIDKKGVLKTECSQNALSVLYVKCMHSINGIYLCVNNGLITETPALLRTLFEAYLTIEIILEKDVESRINLWYEYSGIIRKHYLDDIKDSYLKKEISKREYRELISIDQEKKVIKNYMNIKSQYNNGKRNTKWYWSLFNNVLDRQNNKTISEYLGLKDDYNSFYNTTSKLIHINPIIDSFLFDNGIRTTGPIFNDTNRALGGASVGIGCKSLIKLLEYFQFEQLNELEPIILNILSLSE
ncbi:MAG: hypothetical protein H8E14_07415 [Candidatus Marinimicrobia bacterium]|nr:hypothetical protein [Candidatus Neomarinimicrobiota bacterium]